MLVDWFFQSTPSVPLHRLYGWSAQYGNHKLENTIEHLKHVIVVQSLNHVWLFAIPWTDCTKPGPFVLHYLLEFAQIHVRWVSDAI